MIDHIDKRFVKESLDDIICILLRADEKELVKDLVDVRERVVKLKAKRDIWFEGQMIYPK